MTEMPKVVYIENTGSSLIHHRDSGQLCQRCQRLPARHSIMLCEPDVEIDKLTAWARRMRDRAVFSPEAADVQVDILSEPKSTFVWRKTWLVCVACFYIMRLGITSLDEYDYK
jgi:hypothetical protein